MGNQVIIKPSAQYFFTRSGCWWGSKNAKHDNIGQSSSKKLYILNNSLYIVDFFNFRVLQENPHLLQLYKDLVITQIITAEEFWLEYSNKLNVNSDTAADAKNPDIGVSGSFIVS